MCCSPSSIAGCRNAQPTNVTAGWHMHLDMLAARLAGKTPTSFWDGWSRLREEYDRRLPA